MKCLDEHAPYAADASGKLKEIEGIAEIFTDTVAKNEFNNDDDDPCTLFGRIPFPQEEFFPPDIVENTASYRSLV